MITSHDGYVLFIHPRKGAAEQPILDELSAKIREPMEHAVRLKYGYMGTHKCVCGVRSTSYNLILPSGLITNSLAVHYLEYHRDEVPQGELEKVQNLSALPPDLLARKKQAIEKSMLEAVGLRECGNCGQPTARNNNPCFQCGAERDKW